MGPMGNAIHAVPSHPIPWDISHQNPISTDKPANNLFNLSHKSSYVYGVFGAQRSRDCTVTVLVSQIKRGHVTAL